MRNIAIFHTSMNNTRSTEIRAHKISQSLVALWAGTLQSLVAKINLTSPNKKKNV